MKTVSYSYVKYSPRVPSLLLTVEKIECEILILFFFLSSSFFLSSLPSSITQNVYGVYERSTHQTNALLSEIFLFLVRASCELRSMSYGPNTRHGGFSVRHFVHNYKHNSINKGGMRTFYLLNDCSNIGKL